MRKIISLLIIISVICAAFFFIQSEVGSDSVYYTKITNKGKKRADKLTSGEAVTSYDYTLKSADDKGTVKTINFSAPSRDKPLRINAYLKLNYNTKKGGVINWEEVQEKDVPTKALAKLK